MSVHRPRIGITTSLADGEQRLDRRYVTSVELAGGLPIIVPMTDSQDLLREIALELDGLVVPGGPAVTIGLVGELPPDLPDVPLVRTRSDTTILEAILEAHRPVLGICYGMQLINAVAGGTIYSDVQRQVEGVLAHSDKRGASEHPLAVIPGSVLSRTMEPGQPVNTYHIQAIASVGEGLQATAHAPDGVVEAIETEDGQVVGVQFHPEKMGERADALFRHLVDRAGRTKSS
ncbi:MAG: gamma-glutamyl-gamma-aminobutyrate hydrolase family protein [Rhodothermales bacterium]|nr:gamma-glutamyl-gamma-aminobutyrate hydrolase family protein [Rhodothermales bacterium]